MLEKLKKYRRDLHQIPELGFELFKTHDHLKKQLHDMGYAVEIVAKVGLVAMKKGKIKEAIAFRADMDALPVLEDNDSIYKSVHQGNMHACGHDAHMAMLLVFAEEIAKLAEPKKSIVFIFQPAEERPGGAKVIVEEGALERYHISSIIGLHVYPELEEGRIGIMKDVVTAENKEFAITIDGKATHGGLPHLGMDAIVVASTLIQSYQTITSRAINPLETSVISFGSIHGGSASNIIPGQVKLTGTIRVHQRKTSAQIIKRMKEINRGLEEMYQVKITCVTEDFYPPVINHPFLVEMAFEHTKEAKEILQPIMASEDFSFYAQKVRGLFAFVGTRNIEKNFIYPLHNAKFDLDEAALQTGVRFYLQMAASLDAL